MPAGPAARLNDPTNHGKPLSPGPGSLKCLIGGQPAWRGIPAAAVGALQAAKKTSDAVLEGLKQAKLSAAGTPGAPAAIAAEQAGQIAAAAAMGGMIAGLASTPSPFGGMPDKHICPVPLPTPPHGPGVVIDGSTTVMIDGLPACRKDDTVLEALGPPDKIAMGCPTVKIGG